MGKKMSAMKAMKMAKKMSGMKRMAMKAKKVSKRGKKYQVFKGSREKTIGGLKKSDLKKNKAGKIVSAKKSNLAKRKYASTIGRWNTAVTKARKALGVKGFQAVGGQTSAGKALLAKARSFYKK